MANFVHADSAVRAPRAAGKVAKKNAQTSRAGWIASFVFELEMYCENGQAAQAKASAAPSRTPPNRQPTSASPSVHSRSQRIDVAWAVEQLGAKLTFIDQDELAWGDLSKYNVIVTGVRAYERRADLRAYNRRLLEYAEQGGTVIVQYNKFEFNQSQYGPYPASVSGNRVSDESVPVKMLVPDHPAFNYPNKVGQATWANWVQERGLYFLGEKDPNYVDLVSMNDSFQDNPGDKLGSLVEAKVGKGRWLYLGLGLWRQLPAGTDGAYQLLANLLSLGKASAQ